ncbi:hypothetical protein TruAng_010581 [Truncatella angustata]|nr:hypothetical protein TruAng_010581 [Truncatella angustata]
MVTFTQSIPHRTRISKSHHDPHARRSIKGEAFARKVPEERLQIDLVDLDDLRDPIKIGTRETSRLHHVAAFLKRRYGDDQDEEPILEDAQIIFYWMDKCLLGDEIPGGISRLHYRALDQNAEDDDDTDAALKFIWSTNIDFDADQLVKIQCALGKGGTIGSLRSAFASVLEIEDANRIVISARGGLRPGLLQGNNWQVNKIKAWLCRKIWIDIAPPKNYIVLRGVNEEYIYHPPLMGHYHSTDFRTLRDWLLSRIITNVHCRASSRLKVDTDDVTMVCKGRILTKRGRISSGQVVDFELTREVADKFIAEEAWLVPETENCAVCSDDKRVSEIPRHVTRSCEHKSNTCKDCVGQWITSSMETLAWDRLKCPECPQLLQFDDVRAFASPDVFVRYDTLAMKAAVANIRDFKCCKALSCAQHNLPWHKGETCEEFDKRNRKQRKGERASEKKVKDITKPCPQCQKDVYKFSGCDHITCVCGHEWCYICLETYYRDRSSFLQCKHKQDCKYFENPPNYEGGRAFMPFLNHMREQRNNQDWQFAPPPPPRPQPPGLDEWRRRPIPANANPFQPQPRPAQPPANEDEHARTQAWIDTNPLQFLMEDFLEPGNNVQLHINHVRRGAFDHGFLGAAALFTMEQLVQRTR